MAETIKLSTDVLVVGGGIAGCFAAIAAKKTGAEVILVDKGYVSSSGQSPYAGTFIYFDPKKDNMKEWLEYVRFAGDYLANLAFTEVTFARSKECVDDMISYGAEFHRDPEGALLTASEGGGPAAVFPAMKSFPVVLRNQVIKEGATIMDRVMITELLVEEGKVCGVIGMTVTEGTPVVVYAKSVILSTGASALKPPGWPVSNLTGDGDMMAYRAGVAITGKEFLDTHGTGSNNPSELAMNPFNMPPPSPRGGGGPGAMKMINAIGEPVNLVPHLNLGVEFEVHPGNAPTKMLPPPGGPGRGPASGPGGPGGANKGQRISCASHGMSCHKTEGIWPAGVDCSTSLPGLYGAGDSLGTMLSGAAYATIGIALAGSAVTGKVAGESAGAYAMSATTATPSDEKIAEMVKAMYAPMERKGGFTPDWVITYLQNITMPYFVLIVKSEERLKAVLSQVRFVKEHIIPKLYVSDAHDLRVALEAKNMTQNLEIKLMAAMERKESRGTHYRDDYPQRDEENMSVWITLRDVDGTPTVEKHNVPEAWSWKEGDPRRVQFPQST